MRLTLRTLLSYLDNVLDAPARAELEKQIESNENAGEWLHRTRDVMRRLKLGTPEIDGTSSVDDPNTVAEYLDRTLPEESVAEFERVCLESDAMLAEVASCHHVLAMVLTDKPPIDPDTQKRLHRLQADLSEAMRSRVEKAHTAPPTSPASPVPAATPEPAPEPTPRRTKTKPQAPSYLREGQPSPLTRWAPAIAALLLFTATAVMAFRPGGWLNPTTAVAAADPEEVETPILPPEPTDAGEMEQPPAEPTEAEATPEPTEPETPAEPTETEASEEGEPTEPPTPAEPEVPAGSEASDAEPETPADEAMPAVEEEAEEEAEVAPTPIRFLGNEETLVVREMEPGSWRRVIGGAEFVETTHFVSLPTYRSRYDLGDGLSLELVGMTEATLKPADAENPQPSIDLAYGRLVLRRRMPAPVADEETPSDATANAAGRAEVVIGGIPYLATLGPNAVLAIAVDRPFQPGHPILETPGRLIAMAHGLAGKIEWTSDDVGLMTSKPRPWIIAGDQNAQVPASLSDPAWVEQLSITPADSYASPELARAIDPESPVWPQLLQIAGEESFGEIRSLAGRCSLPLGHPDPLVDAFRNPDEMASWETYLTALRQSASRDREQAGEVQRVFAEAFGERTAEELIDLVIGFEPQEVGLDPEGVARGVIPESVLPALKSDDLATRVLGSLVLKETIQPLDRPYKPLATPRSRLKSTRWIESQLGKQQLQPVAR